MPRASEPESDSAADSAASDTGVPVFRSARRTYDRTDASAAMSAAQVAATVSAALEAAEAAAAAAAIETSASMPPRPPGSRNRRLRHEEPEPGSSGRGSGPDQDQGQGQVTATASETVSVAPALDRTPLDGDVGGAAAAASSSGSSSNRSSGSGPSSPESLVAARARALQIKAALYRNMRSETRTPSANSVKLIFSPVEPKEGTAPAAEPPRAEPLPPPPSHGRDKLLAPATTVEGDSRGMLGGRRRVGGGVGNGGAAATNSRADDADHVRQRRRTAEALAELRIGERRRREEQRQRQQQQRQEGKALAPASKQGLRVDDVDVEVEEAVEVAGEEREARIGGLKRSGGLPWRRDPLAEAAPAPAGRYVGGHRTARPVTAAGTSAAAVGGVAAAAAAEAAAEAEAEAGERTRRDKVQRANEEFARSLERVAAAAAAVAEGEGESGGDGVEGPGRRRLDHQQPQGEEEGEDRRQWRREQQATAAAEHDQQQRRHVREMPGNRQAAGEQVLEERRQQQREQANMLRDLANMFRSFARQVQPSAAAAAAAAAATMGVAAVNPAAAAAVATARADAGSAECSRERGQHAAPYNPLPGFLGLPQPNDSQLVLKPLTVKDLTETDDVDAEGGWSEGATAAASAGGALLARQLPTRGSLLQLLQPIAKAQLPPYTRSVGLRISTRRRPRVLRLPLSVPSEALEIVGDGDRMPATALRALRRRSYYYRQLAPQHQQVSATTTAAAAAAVAASVPSAARDLQDQEQQRQEHEHEQQQQQQHVREKEPAARGSDDVMAGQGQGEPAAAAAALPRPRPYSLSGRVFKVKRRAQYSDVLKRTVRRAALDRNATAAAATATATATAAAATAAAAAAATTTSAGGGEEGEEGELEDPRGEYNSAAEVVNDVYEQIMGVRLPERAMYGKRAETLAAMTPSSIREQTRSWIEACGKDYALAFHAREPLLLATPAETLLLSLEHFSRAFGLPPGECVQLALRNPALIGLPYEQLQGTVEAVSEALEIGLQEAGKIVIKCPGLALRQPNFPVARRLELLGALLPVSKDKLRQVVRQRPQLLSKSAQSLATFVIGTSAALDMSLFEVALMIAGCPGICGVNSRRLGLRWSELRRLTDQVPLWRQQLAAMSPPSLGRCLVASDTALGRLQVVVDRGLVHDPELSSFKKVLTMSTSKFEAALASGTGTTAKTSTNTSPQHHHSNITSSPSRSSLDILGSSPAYSATLRSS
ncbi:hypothetical protein VOLCADRAFT_118273 [Volvox carteri f. nagariensis]|uniref:Uncharacterized protein n=1 Tax=Volvox carteri f. nagariensis TaxID=3068 RepID=D8U353_VOLCA|nr:uncharacterized protein VOLCADRAFT_118273 [Volvox carteri f. nagariensis]EFJ46017.1 hypothetical protein VOLCADRAFT_118273 [Volvox carteri f. nagariensis]|eukprot:XP_002953095.1 hypothetical protein VOLCADRAFT_118273 [Volvox carteri f. nagariensis]